MMAQTVPMMATRWRYETRALRADAAMLAWSPLVAATAVLGQVGDQAESMHVLSISSNSSPSQTWTSQCEILEMELR